MLTVNAVDDHMGNYVGVPRRCQEQGGSIRDEVLSGSR